MLRQNDDRRLGDAAQDRELACERLGLAPDHHNQIDRVLEPVVGDAPEIAPGRDGQPGPPKDVGGEISLIRVGRHNNGLHLR
jgi:hypothetical protein